MSWSKVVTVGALAAMFAIDARADDAGKTGKIEDPARVGQPGGTDATRSGGRDAPVGTRELSGKVLKAQDTTVYVEHMGAVVPFRVDEKTRFLGEGVKSTRDLKEGQEVRATFSVKDTTNVADRIAVQSASGRPPETERGTPSGRPESLPPGHPPIPPERDPRFPPDRAPAPRDPGTPPVNPGGPSVPKY